MVLPHQSMGNISQIKKCFMGGTKFCDQIYGEVVLNGGNND